MNRKSYYILFIASPMLLVSIFATGTEEVETKPISVTGKIHWIFGYDQGQKLARETGKPMWVVFRCER
ncbi:MAG: hypothetical protein HY735_18385 [Verrucomicrobia bacterium]|nr:hypothetical protein [Verrucomicrobiota bacterium]